MGRRQVPSYVEVLELPAQVEATVLPEHIDLNGHMNIRHYLAYGARSSAEIFAGAGLTADYRTKSRRGIFTAEHHLTYLSELREGERLTVHARVIARSTKAVHLTAMLVNRDRKELCYVLEVVLVHVDLDSRRSTPWPPSLASAIDDLIARHRSLQWAAPACGSMQVT